MYQDTFLKADLLHRGPSGDYTEVCDLFGRQRDDAFVAILGNLEQTVFGEPVYLSIEEKGTHLLYFVIKNNPFLDGDKCIDSFLFVLFLNRNSRLANGTGELKINNISLTVLALWIANPDPDSDPKTKDVANQLVINRLVEG